MKIVFLRYLSLYLYKRYMDWRSVRTDLNFFLARKTAPSDCGVYKHGLVLWPTKAMCFPFGRFALPVRDITLQAVDTIKRRAYGPQINRIV